MEGGRVEEREGGEAEAVIDQSLLLASSSEGSLQYIAALDVVVQLLYRVCTVPAACLPVRFARRAAAAMYELSRAGICVQDPHGLWVKTTTVASGPDC